MAAADLDLGTEIVASDSAGVGEVWAGEVSEVGVGEDGDGTRGGPAGAGGFPGIPSGITLFGMACPGAGLTTATRIIPPIRASITARLMSFSLIRTIRTAVHSIQTRALPFPNLRRTRTL